MKRKLISKKGKSQLPSLTEHQIQTLIKNYLQAKGWFVMRLNSGKYSVGEGRFRRFIQGQDAGTPDLVAFQSILAPMSPVHAFETRQTRLMFIEVKRPGNKPTFLQQHMMDELEKHGARCFVATSIEDLQAYNI